MKLYQTYEKGIKFEDAINDKPQKPTIQLLTPKGIWDAIKNIPFEGYSFANQINDVEALYYKSYVKNKIYPNFVDEKYLIISINRHININVIGNGMHWQEFVYNAKQIKSDFKVYEHIISHYKNAKVWDWRSVGVIFK